MLMWQYKWLFLLVEPIAIMLQTLHSSQHVMFYINMHMVTLMILNTRIIVVSILGLYFCVQVWLDIVTMVAPPLDYVPSMLRAVLVTKLKEHIRK